MKETEIPELLAPAGSEDALYAAVSAGADAVYLSGKKFGARRFAQNFSDAELKSAIEYCHARGVRVYVTLNTLVLDDEMADALGEMLLYYSLGADAVLVQDTGLLKAASQCIPGLCLHASTQMTINSTPGVVQACRMNLLRVVLSRELSLQEIEDIYDSSGECRPELEIFIHGALCFCYSGQCLFSSLIGGRSGNRGMCAQPCRKRYTLLSGKKDSFGRIIDPSAAGQAGPYLFSPRDLCSYDNLAEIAGSKVCSLKIEGRMKSAGYVAVVVSVYRKALDAIKSGAWEPSGEERTKLLFAFNRLFTGGYLGGESGPDIMSQDRPDNRGVFLGKIVSFNRRKKTASVRISGDIIPETGDGLAVKIKGRKKEDGFILRPPYSVKEGILTFKSSYSPEKGDPVYITRKKSVALLASDAASADGGIYRKIPVDVEITFFGCRPVVKGRLELFGETFDVGFEGSFEMAEAEKKPVTVSDLKTVFSKTGGLQFSLGSFSADYSETLFAPVRLLNELRRDFFCAVEDEAKKRLFPSAGDLRCAEKSVREYLVKKQAFSASASHGTKISFYADNCEAVRGAAKAGCSRIYFEPDCDLNQGDCESAVISLIEHASEICREYDSSLVWKWPRITSDRNIDFAVSLLKIPGFPEISAIMTESFGAAYAAKKAVPEMRIYGSAGLNIFNSEAVVLASGLFSSVTLSQELSGSQIKKLLEKIPCRDRIETEYIVHGAAELMISENNIITTSLPKNRKGQKDCAYAIRDEKDHVFPVHIDSRGRTHLYNSAETCLIDSLPDILETGPEYIAADGRRKGFDYAYSVVKSYARAVSAIESNEKGIYDILEKEKKNLRKISCGGITEGHYRRGV